MPSLLTGLPSPQQKQAYNRSPNPLKKRPSLQREPENEGFCISDFLKSVPLNCLPSLLKHTKG